MDYQQKMAKRRITQETFDAAVRENMEEFEMAAAEALKEAVEQFESQGNTSGEKDNNPHLCSSHQEDCSCIYYGDDDTATCNNT